ncbi:hypothetical protein ACEPAI_10115 [Sanghuangporus weigelae]
MDALCHLVHRYLHQDYQILRDLQHLRDDDNDDRLLAPQNQNLREDRHAHIPHDDGYHYVYPHEIVRPAGRDVTMGVRHMHDASADCPLSSSLFPEFNKNRCELALLTVLEYSMYADSQSDIATSSSGDVNIGGRYCSKALHPPGHNIALY